MNLAIILRGIPGSGKSTLARELARDVGVIHSTDDFLVVNGRYKFDSKRLSDAHSWNRLAFRTSLDRGIPVVICDNTNVHHGDYAPYVEAARRAGYEVRVISLPHPDPEVAARRSIHGVPLSTIRWMLANWES